MFQNDRYITCGVSAKIPVEVQVILWAMIDDLPSKKVKVDYLQVFRLSEQTGRQKIVHTQEQPKYQAEVLTHIYEHVVEAKIFVIDDGDHSTMMLAAEY